MDRLAPGQRPAGLAQGFQRWHRLLFAHWEVPAEALRPLVPARLELDAFEGRYYAGAVAFTMQNVRPYRWAPSVPTATEFGEINLRTYVHLRGGEPGVFFFSLDASSSLAVWAARTFWGLPYYRSDIAIQDRGAAIDYKFTRRAPRFDWNAQARLGAPLSAATPGTLEHFLCERYQFYAEHRGRLRRARVHHVPYPLQTVEHADAEPSLLRAAGLPCDGARAPFYFSPGVNVEVFALEDVT